MVVKVEGWWVKVAVAGWVVVVVKVAGWTVVVLTLDPVV